MNVFDLVGDEDADDSDSTANAVQPEPETLTPEQKLAKRILGAWILSDDPLDGEDFDAYARGLGCDPDRLREMVEEARAMYPRLGCGHYDIKSNIYTRYGRKQCRQCATPENGRL